MLLQGLLNLYLLECLDDVAHHEVVEALDAETAFIATGNLLGVVLEALE